MKKVIDKINDFLIRSFNIKLIKFKSLPQKVNATQNTKTLIFRGPSAVGKSTLVNFYIQHHQYKNHRKWYIINDIARFALNNKVEITGAHEKILNHYIEEYAREELNGTDKFKLISGFDQHLKYDYIATHFLNNAMIILDEQPLLPYFLNEKDLQFTKEEQRAYFANKIFVFCWSSPQRIIRNIKKRAKMQPMVWFHRDLNDEELVNFIEKVFEQQQKQIKLLHQMQIPFLELNLEDNLKENTQKIDAFLQENEL